MFGTIQIEEVMFLSAVSGVETSALGLQSEVESFPDYQSASQVITQYEEQFAAFRNALTKYQALLVRDVAMIRQAGKALVEMDKRLLK